MGRGILGILVSSLGLCIAACGGMNPSDTDSTASDTLTDSDTQTSESTSVDETTQAPWEPALIRGLTLTHVEATQGVTVEIGRDGQPVPGPDRSAYLLQGRRTVLRAYWALGEGWEPREVEARLDLFYPDGHEVQLVQRLYIEEDAFVGDLGRSFYFGLEAADTVPGLRYRIGLWETEPGHDDLPKPAFANQVPQGEDQDTSLGIESSEQVMEIRLVPFTYNVPGCQASADVSEQRIARFYELMYQMNPVDRLELTVLDPVEWTEPLDSFTPLNVYMSMMRFENEDPPHIFYFGLINPCAGQIGGYGGLAHGIPMIPPIPEESWIRVSTGIDLPDDDEWTGETFVHEVGHTQGRFHIDGGCGSAGADPDYPYPSGELGAWGFGVLDFGLRHPSVYKDFMTYCHPYWVSAWSWNKVYQVVSLLTSWANADDPPADPYSGSLLIGTFDHLGNGHWYTVPGGLGSRTRSSIHRLRFVQKSGTAKVSPAAVIELPEGAGYHIVAELPPDFSETTSVQHLVGEQRVATLEPGQIQQSHQVRNIRANRATN